MQTNIRTMTAAFALAAAATPVAAFAQTTDEMMAMSVSSLKGEIGKRYDAALAMTRDGATIAANDPRHLWASQAKAQCGVALGFLKSSTKDPVSIGKCIDAYNRMMYVPPEVPVPVAPTPVDNPACREPIAGIVFFEWDSTVVPDSAMPTIQAAAQNLATCGWTGLTVAGHADRSGSDAYNDGLARRRADAVAQLITGRGAAAGAVEVTSFGEREPKVPTADGERNPQNRRVEITVKN